jgi:uncharacterized protein (DUF305 family)
MWPNAWNRPDARVLYDRLSCLRADAVGRVQVLASSKGRERRAMGSLESEVLATDNGAGSTTTLVIPEGAEFNATDVYFAQGMIPHHAQAVEMADMALETSTNPDVTALAEQIKAAQGPEIEQMTTWLTDWNQEVPDLNTRMDENMDHSGGMTMSGMMSAADMARLGNATGPDFDRMFLEMMVLHHEGAIEMAEQELADGTYQPTKDLAQAVITGQQAEIDEMNALIAALPA